MTSTNLETLHAGRHLSLVRRGHWEFATRHGATGVVALVAVTGDKKMLLVEQARPPLGKRVIELPAGLSGDIVGEESESLVTAARRELLEETGYEAQEVRLLTEGPSSAGLTDEMISFFLMTGLNKTGDGGGDDSEDIVVHEVPLAAMPGWLEEHRQAGWAIDPKIYVGLFWIEHNSRSLDDNGRYDDYRLCVLPVARLPESGCLNRPDSESRAAVFRSLSHCRLKQK